nr:hypothetical protein [Nafulsella turpanensis]
MLFTAAGFSVQAHLCAGEWQDFAFYSQAEECPMKAQLLPSCHSSEQAAEEPAMPCCENHSYQLEQHDETVGQAAVKIAKPELKLIALAYTFILPLLEEAPPAEVIPEVYQQPPIARDIPVFVQSFLL